MCAETLPRVALYVMADTTTGSKEEVTEALSQGLDREGYDDNGNMRRISPIYVRTNFHSLQTPRVSYVTANHTMKYNIVCHSDPFNFYGEDRLTKFLFGKPSRNIKQFVTHDYNTSRERYI